MFKKILIANRGEIALRIVRACRQMGITSAVVYSKADKESLPVLLADENYFVGDAPSKDSYLNISNIVEALKKSKADAVHPGYGFLSENAQFANTVEKLGITFIGPSSKSIEIMGDKIKARQFMKEKGVPVIPGSHQGITNLDGLISICQKIGFPVMLKAAFGGGGKGMRVVHSLKDLELNYKSAKSEAANYFANDSIYVEKFIENPKHIEMQIFADTHRNAVCLYERECSLQRRHQKVIEESPSPVLPEDTRQKMKDIVIKATKSMNYIGAGTFEFILDNNTKEFFFMEMNTRLQVEHPVTEMITGLDLVKEQISVAAGNKLGFQQEDIKPAGHAIEARICGEDPDTHMPSPGLIKYCHLPQGPFIRVDAYIDSGYKLPIHYDPMIAKVIAWGRTRKEAIDRLQSALLEINVAGIKTNVRSLRSILQAPQFIDGFYTTQLLDKQLNTDTSDIFDSTIALIVSSIEAYKDNKQKYSKKLKINSEWKFKGRIESLR